MAFEPKLLKDITTNGLRIITVETSNAVCSQAIQIAVDGDRVAGVEFAGGCSGNTQGVAALIRGMKVKDAIERIEGISCHGKGTSCPDQLAKALKLL